MKWKLFILLFVFAFSAEAQKTDDITLLFVGDIMQHGYQLRAAKTDSGYNYHPNYEYAKHIIRQADVAIGNLELTLSGSNYSGYPSFSAPDELAVALKDAGFDFLVTANNHSLDRRKKGLERTLDVLDSLEIPHTGTFKNAEEKNNSYPAMIEKNGFKIALLNYTYGTNGIPVSEPNIVNMLDKNQIQKDIRAAKAKNPDIVIVFTHWGFEYKNLPSSEQKEIAQMCIEEGVDLVIGSHPHVLQPIERIKNSHGKDQLIAYSLGNYISNQRKRYTDGGLSVEVSFTRDSTGVKMDKAGYYFSWVYPKPSDNGQFYILPSPLFEHDTHFIEESLNRDKMALFLSDSRRLFSKHNKNILEYRAFPMLEGMEPDSIAVPSTPSAVKAKKTKPKNKETVKKETPKPVKNPKAVVKKSTIYRIQIFVSSNEMDKSLLSDGWEDRLKIVETNRVKKYQLGDWESREAAEEFLEEVRANENFKDAFIVVINE